MKHILTITLTLAGLAMAMAQQQPWQVLPEGALGLPQGNFSKDALNAGAGFGGQLHLDRIDLYKNFGLGVVGGYHSFATDLHDIGLNPEVLQLREGNVNFKNLLLGLGPNYSLLLGESVQLQVFGKAGVAHVTMPEYSETAMFPNSNEVEYFNIQPTEGSAKWHFMMQTGLRLNFKMTKDVWLATGVHYTHINKVAQIHHKPAVELDPEASADLQYEQLRYSNTQVFRELCNINNIGITVGINIPLGGNPKSNPKTPSKTKTPTEDYTCNQVVYEAPGNNDYVVLSENPSAVFMWNDNNTPNAKSNTGYQLIFYIMENGNYKEVDRRVMKSKRRFKIGLNPEKPYPDNALYWQIVPLDAENNEFCPLSTKIMRLWVFKDQAEAIERLPDCLTQGDVMQQDTDFFRIRN